MRRIDGCECCRKYEERGYADSVREDFPRISERNMLGVEEVFTRHRQEEMDWEKCDVWEVSRLYVINTKGCPFSELRIQTVYNHPYLDL